MCRQQLRSDAKQVLAGNSAMPTIIVSVVVPYVFPKPSEVLKVELEFEPSVATQAVFLHSSLAVLVLPARNAVSAPS